MEAVPISRSRKAGRDAINNIHGGIPLSVNSPCCALSRVFFMLLLYMTIRTFSRETFPSRFFAFLRSTAVLSPCSSFKSDKNTAALRIVAAKPPKRITPDICIRKAADNRCAKIFRGVCVSAMPDSDAAACISEPFHFFLKEFRRSFPAAALASRSSVPSSLVVPTARMPSIPAATAASLPTRPFCARLCRDSSAKIRCVRC